MSSPSGSGIVSAEEAQATLWDVVIVGAGVGGATLGHELARFGRRVLFLERGLLLPNCPSEATPPGQADAARQRLEAAMWPESFTQLGCASERSFFHPIGCGSGGSSAIFCMVMERLRPQDFNPRRFFPKPEESSVPDEWPISYDDLAPYYARAESLYRVRGTPDPLFEHAALLPPPAANVKEQSYLEGLRQCGLHPYRFHYACEQLPGCEACMGRPCLRGCRNDAGKICLKPALDEHGARILPECVVTRLQSRGRAVQSAICKYESREMAVRAQLFVLAANAYLTPALLFRSANGDFSEGLGNSSGLVGRNLMLHVSDRILLCPAQPVSSARMAHGISLNDYYVVDGEKLGNVHAHPLAMNPSSVRPLGVLPFATIVEDLPYPSNRVLPPRAADDELAYEYVVPDELRRRSHTLLKRFSRDVSPRFQTRLHGDDSATLNLAHACGTCRFGDDPTKSVLDRHNRLHDVDNLYVVDASFFPSSGGLNPSLTIAANALRVAPHIDHRL